MTGSETETGMLERAWPGLPWLLAGAVGSAMLILFLLPPSAMGYACPFFSLTGHSCFSCGLTRSVHAALHGDLEAAFRYHLMGPLLLAAAATFGASRLFEGWTGRKVRLGRTQAKMALAGLVLLWLAFGTVRLILEIIGR